MLKKLMIQVQPARAPLLDMEAVEAACRAIVATPFVAEHYFNEGHDGGHYFNFQFKTDRLPALWREIQLRLYGDSGVGPGMTKASMAMCEGEHGWDDYLLLYHFDPAVPVVVLPGSN